MLLIILTASAVALTFIRERPIAPEQITDQKRAKEGIPLKEISSVVDSTLKYMGVPMEKLRRSSVSVGEITSVREEIKIPVPSGFEVLRVLTALTDSLRRFNVLLASTENLKEKTSTIHLSFDKHVFESIVFSKERQQKGAASSARKKQKVTPRKARR